MIKIQKKILKKIHKKIQKNQCQKEKEQYIVRAILTRKKRKIMISKNSKLIQLLKIKKILTQ